MKYLIDLPGELFGRIRVKLGEHRDLSSFFLLAAENQLALEAGDLEPGAAQENESVPRALPNGFRGAPVTDLVSADPIPFDKRSDIRDAQGVPWLWGQVNRVFPIKCLTRAMLHLAPVPTPFDELARALAEPLRGLGFYLLDMDKRKGTRRDERLSVGFPIGPDRDAAISRFLSLFLGETRQDGRVAGALFTLGLAGIDPSGFASLTDEGAAFGRLDNPVLDGGEAAEVLSGDERRAYLDHILSSCPGEVSAFATIAAAVRGGRSRNAEVEERLAAGPGAPWSEAVVSTQRSGAMGRMLDLGLITRTRHGRRVEFGLTADGRAFLTRAEEWSGATVERAQD
ncbi:MAG TPA: hypothetical protein VLH75_20095 [Longimicrobiales bacterium]|nr:hypothetical protein [Longimicrobiales bacterium]